MTHALIHLSGTSVFVVVVVVVVFCFCFFFFCGMTSGTVTKDREKLVQW